MYARALGHGMVTKNIDFVLWRDKEVSVGRETLPNQSNTSLVEVTALVHDESVVTTSLHTPDYINT